jgi:hypothetical protein
MPLVMHPRIGKGVRRVAALAVLACFAGPAAAQAACPTPPTAKAFQAFGDSSDYFLAPNGGFESGTAAWTVSNASVVSGNESYKLHGAGDSRSLRLAPGGTAVTAAICLDTTRTGYRFFARQPGNAAGPDLNVSVRFVGKDGITRERQIDTLAEGNYRSWAPSRFWAPSVAAQMFQAIGLTVDDTATVRLVFTAENVPGPAWQLDDLYIDPYRTG